HECRTMPDQRKHSSHARKDNGFLGWAAATFVASGSCVIVAVVAAPLAEQDGDAMPQR
ncbi:hypothetical protein GA0115260_1024730, partial [Streptomyces sp. MnatMP-M27]